MSYDCIEWDGPRRPDGYGYKQRDNVRTLAHRLAYVNHHGLSLDDIRGLVIRHACDNPSCVNPDHLSTGTQADNLADMRSRDRQVRGESHGHAKMNEVAVRAIRFLAASGRTNVDIARAYGVSDTTICKIVNGKAWRHVE